MLTRIPIDCFDIVLNGQPIPLRQERADQHFFYVSNALVSASARSGSSHQVNLTVLGHIGPTLLPVEPGTTPETVTLTINAVDGYELPAEVAFRARWTDRTGPATRLSSLTVDHLGVNFDFRCPLSSSGSQTVAGMEDESIAGDSIVDGAVADEFIADDSSFVFDIDAEVESLRLLEQDAQLLHAEIGARKQAISLRLAEYHSHVSLNQIIKQCDGIVCAAKAIATRINEKVTIATQPRFDYTKLQSPMSAEKDATCSEGNGTSCFRSEGDKNAVKPALMGGNTTFKHRPLSGNTTFAYHPDIIVSPDPFVRALSIVASVLGLAALFNFVRRKCMSMRRRVERAADLEERRTARAYRRAARRATMRQRWHTLVSAVSCFGARQEPPIHDYDEKRALLLIQDAFLEQDPDLAEKGDIMEAEIRELRHAHDIVASLVRRDHTPSRFMTVRLDPPPPLVPLPYTAASRSRASTGTLPSYTSETLPDYDSSPDRTEDPSRVADGFVHYTPSPRSRGRSPRAMGSACSEHSHPTRSSPTSSVVGISPRISAETLRTRRSKDTAGS